MTAYNCTDCTETLYNPELSLTSNYSANYTATSLTVLPDYYVLGEMAMDRVCLSQACLLDFNFFMIETQTNLDFLDFDGLIGLGPYSGGGPSIVKALFD